MLDLVHAAFAAVHVGAAALWLGAMVYSSLVLQRRAAEFFRDPEEREDFTVMLAAGARWKVLGLCAALGLSGVGLTGVAIAEADPTSALWLALVGAKAALLVAAVALFAYVSWRLWPARLLAHLAGSPDLALVQRRFRTVALALTLTVAAGLVLGSVADAVGPG